LAKATAGARGTARPLDDRSPGLRRGAYLAKVKALVARDAPFDRIGFMGHVDDRLTAIPRVWAELERYAAFGKDLQVTEYDIVGSDAQTRAAYTRDRLTLCFSHPRMRAFLLWGFWDGQHWKQDALLFDHQWRLKPAGKAWMDLVHGAWQTDATVKTDASGLATMRGFLGDYEIEARHGDLSASISAPLPGQGATVVLRLAKPFL